MGGSLSNDDRTRPPTEWEERQPVLVIDPEVGVYLAPLHRLDDGLPRWTFWHWCTFANTRKIEPRWLPMGLGNHTVVAEEPVHLTPSLLCPECGLHGFIHDGRWVPA
jgi:hypothetical protein